MHILHVFESFDAMKQEISDSQKSLLNSTTSTYFTLSDLTHRYWSKALKIIFEIIIIMIMIMIIYLNYYKKLFWKAWKITCCHNTNFQVL
jgi:hypothetical protein